MKKEEVPQDGKYLAASTLRDVYYAVDEKGDYCSVSSVGWDVKNAALSLTWESIAEQAEAVRKEVIEGKKSPLAYHMEMNMMTPSLLSSYTGISKKTIRAQMTPQEFSRADEATLNIYAAALSISSDELKTVDK